MSEETKKIKEQQREEFQKLIDLEDFNIPQVDEIVKGAVISASKSEVKLDINGIMTGVVRGPELYEEDETYASLKPGDEVEATVIATDNENGELELSFRVAGQEKAWTTLQESYREKNNIKIRIVEANKGGLLAKYRQISGFLPVSQLAPENYPRVNGGDKSKILERLKSYIGREFTVKVMNLDTNEDKIIFSEKDAWNELQQDVISKYKVGTKVEGVITAITDFGVFVSFGENLEGLIHISELAWQRIDDPSDLFKVGDTIKAEIISVEDSKIFLSAKKLLRDPWMEVSEKYKVGQVVEGTILKVNPFGLFVSLDNDIHGLAHISQLGLAPKEKINEKYKSDQKVNFTIVSIEPKEHRLGLAMAKEGKAVKAEAVKEEAPVETKEEKSEEKEKKPKKEKAKTEKKKETKKKKAE